jgi:hypothetical protein
MSFFALHIHYITIDTSFFSGQDCVGHSFAYIAYFVFCIFERCLESTRTQRAAVASRCANNLANNHPSPLTFF